MYGIRQTLRSLWRAKGFTAIAVSMLALGIGAMTAIFSVVNTVILSSNYHEPERLYVIDEFAPRLAEQFPSGRFPVNARHFDEWRKACTVCSGFGLMQGGGGANLSGDGTPERVRILGASHDLLPTLGIAAALGWLFLPTDDQPDAPPVILLTDGFWRRRFQANPSVVGSEIRLNNTPITVIGVLPPTFEAVGGAYLREFGFFRHDFEGLRPLRLRYSEIQFGGGFSFGAVVRLKPGATPEQAADQMNAALRGFSDKLFVRLRPLDEAVLGGVSTGLWILFAAVGAVLLIVCVNLGNLMMVRAERRRREAAVRRALGATSFRLLGQVMREGLALAILGGAFGVLVAHWAIEALVLTAPVDLPRLNHVRLNWTALGFGFCITAAVGLLTSFFPALRYGGASLHDTLREAQATATASGRRVRSRGALVAMEVALSAVLLIVAALLGTSFFRLMSVERGFVSENVTSFDLVLPPQVYPFADGSRGRFHERLLERIAAIPGVRSAGLTTKVPLEGSTYVDSVRPAGLNIPLEELISTNFRFVSAGYWQTMGIELLAGRLLEHADAGRRAAVISEGVARKVWPGENPIGKRFVGGPSSEDPYEVVGVVAEVRTTGLDEQTAPIAYLSYWELQLDAVSYAVRTAGDTTAFASLIRNPVWSIDPALPVMNLRTMDQVVAKSVAP